MERSGLLIDGQVRHLQWLRHANGDRLIVVARNNDKLQILRPRIPDTGRQAAPRRPFR
jgi:hypothetical protein